MGFKVFITGLLVIITVILIVVLSLERNRWFESNTIKTVIILTPILFNIFWIDKKTNENL